MYLLLTHLLRLLNACLHFSYFYPSEAVFFNIIYLINKRCAALLHCKGSYYNTNALCHLNAELPPFVCTDSKAIKGQSNPGNGVCAASNDPVSTLKLYALAKQNADLEAKVKLSKSKLGLVPQWEDTHPTLSEIIRMPE